jgi:hypothetical protein
MSPELADAVEKGLVIRGQHDSLLLLDSFSGGGGS